MVLKNLRRKKMVVIINGIKNNLIDDENPLYIVQGIFLWINVRLFIQLDKYRYSKLYYSGYES